VRRVSVVGNSGSGKSTLSKSVAEALGCPWLELDSVFHQRDWTPLDRDQFTARVCAAAAGDSWVIDGNYSVIQSLVWDRADTVVFLDLPRRIVMRRVIWRTLRRVARRQELWNGNRERWRNVFTWDPAESVISWAWHNHGVKRERYAAAAADPAYAHLRFVFLRSPSQVRLFLAGLGSD
jgi:adenylate kinase family enzyme